MFIATCERFESLPDTTVFTVVGLVCALIGVADIVSRLRTRGQ